MQDMRNQIRHEIEAELARIAHLGPMLKGTVNEVRRGPKKTGTGERKAYLLTFKGKGNKTRSLYVPARRVAEVQDMVAKHREAIRAIGKVVELSVDLFKQKDRKSVV